jgi:hypothetical protein
MQKYIKCDKCDRMVVLNASKNRHSLAIFAIIPEKEYS